MPSDRPPVLTPKELALTAADGKELPRVGNGQAPNLSKGGFVGGSSGSMADPFGLDPITGPFGTDAGGTERGDDGSRGS